METEANYKPSFLDVLVYNSHPDFLVTSVFPKKTHTGLFSNVFSFTPFRTKLASFAH